jgi:CRISPR-associated endonuclease/helicase Cas3
MQAVTGHHGMPPKANGQVNSFFLRSDKQAAGQFVQAMASLLLTDESRRIPLQTGADFETNSQMLSWWFAGVTVLADWLGSNTNFFSYQQQEQDLEEYWSAVKRKADRALAHSGVLPVPVKPGKQIRDFFTYIDEPSPLQHWAATVGIPQSPQIYLLEDVTGAGKTEAALMLAYRLMAQGAAEGFFIGLPTMATANAMYHRIADVYRKLFEGMRI